MKTKNILKNLGIAIGILTILVSVNGVYAMARDEIKGQEGMITPELTPEPTPQYIQVEVLVKFKEGSDPSSILRQAGIETQGIERIHSIKPAVTKFRKDYKLEKDTKGGWYSFLGKKYKEVSDIPDDEMFKEAYKAMPEVEKTLYRSYKIGLPEGMSVEEAIAKLSKNPNMESASPNYLIAVNSVPNDPKYKYQWALPKIRAPEAWDIMGAADLMPVAVIDTGVDYKHEDLEANMLIKPAEDINHNGKFDNWPSTETRNGITGDLDGIDNDENGYVDDVVGYDFVTSVSSSIIGNSPALDEDGGPMDNDPMDIQSHGTFCAGILGAVKNNGKGIAGVAPNARIMALRAGYKTRTGGGLLELIAIKKALKYATDNGAKVISMSFGSHGGFEYVDEINTAAAANIVLVASSGNDNTYLKLYPAALDEVISVAATDQNDIKAYFSNYGPWIEVAAPGVNIWSTLPNNQYGTNAGTSLSCPHVSGVAALILGKNKDLGAVEVRNIIRNSATDVGHSGREPDTGFGVVNAYKALNDMNTALLPEAIISVPAFQELINNANYEVKGTASGMNFDHYDVEIGLSQGTAPAANFQPIAGNIRTSVINTVLANFNTSDYPHNIPGEHRVIRLSVYDTAGHIGRFSVQCDIDPTLLSGWPVRNSSMGISSPVVADINLDGKDKIIYITASLLAYRNNCTTLLDLPLAGQTIKYNVAVGDIDPGFPGLEVAVVDVFGGKRLLAIHSDRTIVSGSGALLNSSVYHPVIADFDGDGQDEVLYSLTNCRDSSPDAINGGPRLYLYKGNTVLAQQPSIVNFNGYRYTGASAADIDLTGGYEILAAVSSIDGQTPEYGSVRVYNYTGAELTWARMEITGAYFINAPVAGDLDSDGNIEVITTASNNKVYIWTINKGAQTVTLLPNWPKDLSGDGMTGLVDDVSLADINSDGNVEITAMHNRKVYIWTRNGDDYAGFPKLWSASTTPLIIGDIDGDKKYELFNTAIYGGTHAYKLDGNEVAGFPKFSYNYPYSNSRAPAVGDVNGDGALDFVIGNSSKKEMGVFTLGQSGIVEWPMLCHDAQNTNNYNYKRGISPDHTPPAVPVVTDEGSYTTNIDRLSASWATSDPESGITEYLYAIGTTQGGTDIKEWTSAGNNISVTVTGINLAPGQTYYFSVKAKNGVKICGDPGYSDGIVLLTPPAAPTNLKIMDAKIGWVVLAWDDNANNEDNFIVMRDGIALGTLPANRRVYVDNKIRPLKVYVYTVYAQNGAGQSALSNAVTLKVSPLRPRAPRDLHKTEITRDYVQLSWRNTDPSPYGFVVERTAIATGEVKRYTIFSGDQCAFQDNNVTAGATYRYVVYAKNTAGLSDRSNQITVSVPR